MREPIDWEKEIQSTRLAARAAARSSERTVGGVAEVLSLLREQQTKNGALKSALTAIDTRLGNLETAQRNSEAQHSSPPSLHRQKKLPLLWLISGALVGAASAAFFMS